MPVFLLKWYMTLSESRNSFIQCKEMLHIKVCIYLILLGELD